MGGSHKLLWSRALGKYGCDSFAIVPNGGRVRPE
jgi:hypothetical protein